MRISIRQDSDAVPYAAQRSRHSAWTVENICKLRIRQYRCIAHSRLRNGN